MARDLIVIDLNEDGLHDERLFGKELELARRRALSNTMRKLRTLARKALRPEFRPSVLKNRLKIANRSLWFGADDLRVLSFRAARAYAPSRKTHWYGKSVRFGGKGRKGGDVLEKAFVNRKPRIAKLALKAHGPYPDRRVDTVDMSPAEYMLNVRNQLAPQAEIILRQEFEKQVRSLIKNRR